MKKASILVFGLLLVCNWESTKGSELRGRFALSAGGGVSYVVGDGFSPPQIEHTYGFAVCAEYFFRETLSAGFSLAHNSFQGKWTSSGYYPRWLSYYSTDWNWTNLSIFGRFTLGPQNKIYPYVKAGAGLFMPRVKDWVFYPPDTTYTHTSYGKGQFGYYVGFGVRYRLTDKVVVYCDIPLNVIHTDDLVIRWVDRARRLEGNHEIHDTSRYINLFLGVSFLLGTGK
jgi:opacity protein-like surface antigen